jgi:hypothetical protein
MEQQIIEIEQRHIDRAIVRPSETVYEAEDVKIFRHVTNRLDLFLTHVFRNHVETLEGMPDKRMAKVQEPVWFFSEYTKPRKALKQLIKSDLGMSDLLSNHMADIYSMDKVVFRHQKLLFNKLLLRDYPQFAEFPELKEIQDVKEDLDLPEGTFVNKQAKRSGLYLMTEEDRVTHEAAKKLFIDTVINIGDGIEVTQRFELDFLMSCKPYGKACRDAYARKVIKPLVTEAHKAFRKHYPNLQQSAQLLLENYPPSKQIDQIPTAVLKNYFPPLPTI